MIIVCGLLAGLILGLACGGRLQNLTQETIRGESVLLVVLISQVAVPLLARSGNAGAATYYVWLASFAVMAGVALANLSRTGFPAVLVGTLLNLLVIAVNGAMPVSGYSMILAGYLGNPVEVFGQNGTATHAILSSQTHAIVLADVMPLPGPQFLQSVVSIGDVLLVVGVAAFLVRGMQGTTQVSIPDSVLESTS